MLNNRSVIAFLSRRQKKRQGSGRIRPFPRTDPSTTREPLTVMFAVKHRFVSQYFPEQPFVRGQGGGAVRTSPWLIHQALRRRGHRRARQAASCRRLKVTNLIARSRQQDRNGGLGLGGRKNADGRVRQSKRRWKELESRLS